MNWRRGLLRFWLVASGCWIAFIIAAGLQKGTDNTAGLVLFALMPVAVAFMLGAAGVWIASGFRP